MQQVINQLSKDSICYEKDPHLPDLLVLPNHIDLHEYPLVKNGSLILQDKASCFPAWALLGLKNGKPTFQFDYIIDGCAAPYLF